MPLNGATDPTDKLRIFTGTRRVKKSKREDDRTEPITRTPVPRKTMVGSGIYLLRGRYGRSKETRCSVASCFETNANDSVGSVHRSRASVGGEATAAVRRAPLPRGTYSGRATFSACSCVRRRTSISVKTRPPYLQTKVCVLRVRAGWMYLPGGVAFLLISFSSFFLVTLF